MATRAAGQRVMWAVIAAVLFLLYLPLVPPLLFSVGGGAGGAETLTLRWYAEMWQNPLLVGSIKTSVLAALSTGVVTPALALLAALAVRELRLPRLIMALVLLPLVAALAERFARVGLLLRMMTGRGSLQSKRTEDGAGEDDAEAAQRFTARQWFCEGFRKFVPAMGHGGCLS